MTVGWVFDLGGHLSHTLCSMFQNVFMLSSFDLHFLLQNGDFPLLYAVRYGQLDICKLLLDHGADSNLIDKVVQCDMCYSYS